MFPVRLIPLALFCALGSAPVLAHGDGGSSNNWPAPAAKAVKNADYTAGKAAIEREDWKTGIEFMLKAASRDPKDADAENYLGFAYRKSGDLPNAFQHYERALKLNPNHLGAHEYLGEAYLQAKDLAGAERQLATLEKLCNKSCEEYEDLKEQVEAARKLAGATPQ